MYSDDSRPLMASTPRPKSFEDIRFSDSDARKEDLGVDSEDEDTEIEDERVNDDAGVCTNRCLCLPEWFRVEFNCTFKLAWPMILNQLFQYLMMPISLTFCGRLSTTEFGAAALAMTIINVTGVSLGCGFATACDTLFSQTYGGDNLKRIGVLLQRSIIFMIIAIIPIWAFHINTESFLILVGQEREQAILAERYVIIFMPGLLFSFEYQVLSKYLQNQNIVNPLIFVGILGCGVNVLFHYIFLIKMDLGTDGSAMAQDLGYLTFVLATIAYIYFSGVYKETWGGWTLEAFADWGTFARYAVPGAFMLFFDMLCFEIGTFAAGILSKEELAAQSVILQLSAVAYQIPLGTSFACSIRVGQHLGAGDHVSAKRAIIVAIAITLVGASATVVVFASSGSLLPSIFTDDICISGLAGDCMPYVAIYLLFDGVSACLSGSFRGCGRQHIGALAIFIGFYWFGTPVALSLMFATALRAQGFWVGMATAVFACTWVNTIITVCFTNWKREARLARRRAGLKARLKSARSQSHMYIADESTGLLENGNKPHGSAMSMASVVAEEIPFRCANVLFMRIVSFILILVLLALGVFLNLFFTMPDIYGLEKQSIPMIPIGGKNTTIFPVTNETNPLCDYYLGS